MIDYNELLLVSIIVIHSRNEWWQECIQSIDRSFYPNKELIIIENMDRKKTIGKCWNEAIGKAKGEMCLFVGDDDAITPEYIMSCVLSFIDRRSKGIMIEGVASNCMAVNVEEGAMTPALMYVTGMWTTDFLLENPFDETLKKKVDYHWMENGAKKFGHNLTWNFGYIYRQHEGQVSGINLDKEAIEYDKRKKRTK